MRTFTLDQYKKISERFNKLSFSDKIKTIRTNSDILTLANDGNWWGVKVKDNDINEQLHEMEVIFAIENEWGSHEMEELIYLLGMKLTDI